MVSHPELGSDPPIGSDRESGCDRFLVHESNISYIHKNTVMESRKTSFFKDVFPYKSKE